MCALTLKLDRARTGGAANLGEMRTAVLKYVENLNMRSVKLGSVLTTGSRGQFLIA